MKFFLSNYSQSSLFTGRGRKTANKMSFLTLLPNFDLNGLHQRYMCTFSVQNFGAKKYKDDT